MPRVVNKSRHPNPSPKDIYVGRSSDGSSKLGNPFSHKHGTLAQFQVGSRDEAIKAYEAWLEEQVRNCNMEIVDAILAIPNNATLVCWCVPRACHALVINRYVAQFRGAIRRRIHNHRRRVAQGASS